MKLRTWLVSATTAALVCAGCSSSTDPVTGTPGTGGSSGNGATGGSGGRAGAGNSSSFAGSAAGTESDTAGAAGSADSATLPPLARVDAAQTPAASISADALAAAVSANNAFGVDLYARVLAASPANNLLLSPISASLALTMTYAGAAGITATEMAKALHFGASAGSTIFDGQNKLSQALGARGAAALTRAQQNAQYGNQPAPQSSDYDLHIVNSVWGEQTYTWETPFLTTLAQSYGTGVYQTDFSHAFDAARLSINHWVSDETQAKINDLLPPGALDDTTRMVLVNAMHLKFPWQSPFPATATANAAFTRGDGSTVMTPFMNTSETLSYTDDGQAQIASIPLSNGELSLLVTLPHDGVTLATYEAGLTATSAALRAPSTQQFVSLSLPKTTFTSQSGSLSKPLQAMGMQSAFDKEAADFSGLCAHPPDGDRLYISDVLQKAMISMQETGVEAAAATAVIVSGNSAVYVPPVPVPMVVNRPYLVALVDGPTGAVLMLGQITDPSDAGSP